MRTISLCIVLGAALVWSGVERSRGSFELAEQWFLDFLVANGREAFAKSVPAQSPEVVLVEFREEDKAEFESWPPTPLDYLLVLNRLVEHEPDVVVFADTLAWAGSGEEFIAQLRGALVKVPSVVLGFTLSSQPSAKSEELADFFASEMPFLAAEEGGVEGVPRFAGVGKVASRALRIAAQSGFSSIEGLDTGKGYVPLVATDGERLVPSLAVQAVSLSRRVPYAAQRLRLGAGARLSLGDEFIIPLENGGVLRPFEKLDVPRVNALELMTPDLGDASAETMRAMLGKHKVVVFGIPPGAAEHAKAIASALILPRVSRLPAALDWAYAALACGACAWLGRRGRAGAVLAALVVTATGLAVCLGVFQSTLA
ncbi:MAG: CHASE2 domain-containing protein, partial [Roseimicrobium sp.]